MTTLAGIFLFVFAASIYWFLSARFKAARFLRASYLVLAIGGLLFIVWSLSHAIAIGIAALALLLIGGLAGVIGALRKELRITIPS